MVSSCFSRTLNLKLCLVCMLYFVTVGCPARSHKTRSSYGRHLLDHLAADRAGLAAGQVAVVALLEVDTDLP